MYHASLSCRLSATTLAKLTLPETQASCREAVCSRAKICWCLLCAACEVNPASTPIVYRHYSLLYPNYTEVEQLSGIWDALAAGRLLVMLIGLMQGARMIAEDHSSSLCLLTSRNSSSQTLQCLES